METGTVVTEVAAAAEGRRIDAWLADTLEGVTRSRIQQLIEQERVETHGKPVTKNYRIRSGDLITCRIPEPVLYSAAAEPIPLDVAYEDDDVIVINKPRGMVVHPAPGHYSGTLVNALLHHCKGTLSGINGDLRPGIVHRIDRDTSGLLVAAKNDRAHQALAAQLSAHTMQRTYHAVVRNNLKEDRLTIRLPIGRHPVDRKKRAVLTHGRDAGRHAVTHITVLARFGVFTLIEARLETGRTHQIRVHMAYIGHPLLGDTVYGGEKQPFGLDGQILHAKTLGFTHPSTGEDLIFDTPLPPYFTDTVSTIRETAWTKTLSR